MRFNRRRLFKYAASVGALRAGRLEGYAKDPENPIVAENRRPGTTAWQLSYVRTQNHRSKMIEGYCSKTSVRPGEKIDFFLSADPATPAFIDFYRMGFYGGSGGRHLLRLGPFNVTPQPEPSIGKNRLRECKWPQTARLTIPDDWLSGVYLGKLSCEKHRYQSYVIFIVRDDRKCDLLFQCSDTTWQAYNKWPDEYSLYDSDPPKQALNARTWVSFDRPYGKYPQVLDQPLSQGSGEFLLWEFPLCFWLERYGYDVSYWSNLDTHGDAEGLKRAKIFLSVGHDEYWSLQMFDHVQRAIHQQGLNVAFLSGNTCMWLIPLSPSSEGRSDRVFYRAGRYGGLMEAEKPTMGPFELDGPNENTLIGARTVFPFNGSADWIATKADHWIFEGTVMRNGDAIPGLVGWEFHGDPAQIDGLEVIASGTTINGAGKTATYTATVYPGPKANWVFNASTIFWSLGLSDPPGLNTPYAHYGRPHGPDERVQKITTNFFSKCGTNRP